MPRNYNYENAIKKINEALSANGMSIDSIREIDVVNVEDPGKADKEYCTVSVNIFVPMDD